MRLASTLLAALVAAPAAPAADGEPKVRRDLAYAEPKAERRTLDVYAPAAAGAGRPVVVWVHGGGWRRGSKADVGAKPRAFTDRGCVFVAVNHRFVPDVTVAEMTGDVAKAVRWVHDHAGEFGGDPDAVFVMGHSSGAHLAALVCTDGRYLKAEGLTLGAVKGCVPVDVSAYDVPKLLADGTGSVPAATYKAVFGEAADGQREVSPAAHVAKGKGVPPFLILHVADRPDTKAQSHAFADKLTAAGVPAKVVAAEGKTHGSIGSDLGKPDDPPTRAVFEFLDGVRKK